MNNQLQLNGLLSVSDEKYQVIHLNNRSDGYTFEELKMLMKMSESKLSTFQFNIGVYSPFEATQAQLEANAIRLAKDFEKASDGNRLGLVLFANMIRIDTVTHKGNFFEYKTLAGISNVSDTWQTIRIKFSLFSNMPPKTRYSHHEFIGDVIEKITICGTRKLPYNSPIRAFLKNKFTISEEERLLLLYGLMKTVDFYPIRVFSYNYDNLNPESSTDWITT